MKINPCAMTQKTMKDTKVHGNLNRKQNSRPSHVEKNQNTSD